MWSGNAALKLGLVDELGGLADAIRFAARKARLGDDYRVTEYPRKKQFAEAFTEALEGRHHEQSFSGPMGVFIRQATAELLSLNRFNDPRGLYARLPFEFNLN